MRYLLFFIFLMLTLTSCKRDFLNPYDTQTPPDTWMPAQFSYTITGTNAIELTWTQPEGPIDGFTLVKRKNGTENIIELGNDVFTYADTAVLEPEESITCTPVLYGIYARAGTQRSNLAKLPAELLFPQLTIANAGADITASSVTVNLAANAPGAFESGQWTIVNGLGGVISNVAAPNSSFTGKTNQLYILEWKITSCDTESSDQVKVTYPGSVAGNGLTDIDGNTYPTQIIGSQEWMSENLKTTRYRDGELITHLTSQSEWAATTNGAWCNYNNSTNNEAIYGKLYNWYAVSDPRNVCPIGWHVPSDAEWSILTDYLGGDSFAGGKMKALNFWNVPNTAATNQSKFSGLPGGLRSSNGEFYSVGNFGYWWSSSVYDSNFAWFRLLDYNSGKATRDGFIKRSGFSVRCLRD
jgi:uncharacterized protein (TIGR02145 family)